MDFCKKTNEVRIEYDDYYVTTEVEFTRTLDQPKDERVGIMSDEFILERFVYWFFTIYNDANEEIKLSEKEVGTIKQDIENKINDLEL